MFVVQGTLIGVTGTLLGLLGGTALALNVESIVPAIEQMFNVEFLAADVYYISDLPSDLHCSPTIVACDAIPGFDRFPEVGFVTVITFSTPGLSARRCGS